MTEPQKTKCPKCDGLGQIDNMWGCNDPECCGTRDCSECNGTGEVDEEKK